MAFHGSRTDLKDQDTDTSKTISALVANPGHHVLNIILLFCLVVKNETMRQWRIKHRIVKRAALYSTTYRYAMCSPAVGLFLTTRNTSPGFAPMAFTAGSEDVIWGS